MNRRLSSTGVLWLTLLFALLSGLVVYGVLSTSSGEPAVRQQDSPAAPTAQEPEPETVVAGEGQLEETAVAGEGQPEEGAPPPELQTEVATAEAAAVNEEAAPADETRNSEADEPAAPARSRTNRQDRSEREVPIEDVPEPRSIEARRDSPAPPRRVPQRQARRSSGSERPRVVDVFEAPPVGSIETVLTGIPNDRRPRWRDRWDDDDEFRRRRMRRIRRENLRPFPF